MEEGTQHWQPLHNQDSAHGWNKEDTATAWMKRPMTNGILSQLMSEQFDDKDSHSM